MKLSVIILVVLALMERSESGSDNVYIFDELVQAIHQPTVGGITQIEEAFISAIKELNKIGHRAREELADYTQGFLLQIKPIGDENCQRIAGQKIQEVVNAHSSSEYECLSDIAAELREIRKNILPILREALKKGMAIIKEAKRCDNRECRDAQLKIFVSHLKATKDVAKPSVVDSIGRIKASLPAAIGCIVSDQKKLRQEVAGIKREFNRCSGKY